MAEKLRIREVINETNEMNEDEDSPLHGLAEPEKLAAVMMAHKAFGCFMGLLEYDRLRRSPCSLASWVQR
jgi:hypothetical protein